MAKKGAKEVVKKGPGRPAKPPGEKVRATTMCASTFPAEVVAFLEGLGDGSRNTGLNRLVWKMYEAAKSAPPIP